VLEDEALAHIRPWHPEANIMFLVRPIDPDEGGEGWIWLWLVHLEKPRVW
jgi:hypothetical protein